MYYIAGMGYRRQREEAEVTACSACCAEHLAHYNLLLC